MRNNNHMQKDRAAKTVRDIRRTMRRPYSDKEKIRIVLEGQRGEDSIVALCRRPYSESARTRRIPELSGPRLRGAAINGKSLKRLGDPDEEHHDYTITRINDPPLDVRVHMVEDYVNLPRCGVGEPGVPPYAPALINAIYDATGKRIRKFPIGDQLRGA